MDTGITPRRISTATTAFRRGLAFCQVMETVLLALILCAVASPVSWAQEAQITITQQQDDNATYDAYCLFMGSVDEQGRLGQLSWPSDSIRHIVLKTLDAHGYEEWLASTHSAAGMHDQAQIAAEYLAELIGSTDGLRPTSIDGGSSGSAPVVQSLAKALVCEPDLQPERAHANTAFSGEEGCWLFVTSMDTLMGSGSAGSSPLLVTLGATPAHVVEKASVPHITAQVQEDSTGTWQLSCDAARKQPVPCRIEGTLPANLSAFDTYYYHITCTLAPGLDLVLPRDKDLTEVVSVCLDGNPLVIDGSSLWIDYDARSLMIDFADLKDPLWADYGLTADSTIEVLFEASLNDNAIVGAGGNLCLTSLVYSNDPVRGTEGTTEAADTAVLTYELLLKKEDKATHKALPGASLVLQVDDETSSAAPSYVQADGSVGEQRHLFETDAQGSARITGIDADTYVITEVSAPQGYQGLSDSLVLHVTSQLRDEHPHLDALEATLSSSVAHLDQVDSSAGSITLTVPNAQVATPASSRDKPQAQSSAPTVERLAQTGVGPLSALLMCLGGAITLCSLALRRKADPSAPAPRGVATHLSLRTKTRG